MSTLVSFLIPPHATHFTSSAAHPFPTEKGKHDFFVVTDRFLAKTEDILGFLKKLETFFHERSRLLFVTSRWRGRYNARRIRTFLNGSNFEYVTGGKTLTTRYFFCRPLVHTRKDVSVSVIVPARNEKGNIEPIVKRLPRLGSEMEIVFVEGGSTDGTAEECRRVVAAYPDRKLKFVQQTASGKGNAVRDGITASSHDLIMILDGDMAIPPEELSYIYDCFANGSCEFITASRLLYPMSGEAMPWINRQMNPMFAWFYSWLFGQKLTDLFGGTKVFLRSDYEKFEKLVPYFKTRDTWGDLDFLFGAAKYGYKILDIPVHYHARLYGVSNMKSMKFGIFLVAVFLKSIRKFKPRYFR